MSTIGSTTSTGQPTPDRAEIEADIVATRAALGETVESLGHRLDVKERARQGVSAAAQRARAEAGVRASAVVGGVRARPAVPVVVLVAVAAVAAAVVLRRRRR
jgi:hypothetical protein